MGRLAERAARTVIVGGGPGGLLSATLIKQRLPHHEVVVFERNPPDATFGFGVVFSEKTLAGLGMADSSIHEAMHETAVYWKDIEVRRNGESIRCAGHGFSAIARRTLLALLQQQARDAGVELHFEHEAVPADWESADLVLAADGVNSTLRQMHEDEFRPHFERGRAKYVWFATPQPFDALTFIFESNEHGQWGVHAYPFERGTSTFIVEADEATWRSAGLDRAGDLPPGASDMHSMRYLEALFAPHLGGHGLLENNSKWLEFQTLSCGSWSAGNVALMGDAAHTAHFSVGSGTKMAMEDAVAMAAAVEECDTVEDALAAYERQRRPEVAYTQTASIPSLAWWERFHHLADRSTEQFAFHFLSRSPQVTRDVLKRRDHRFMRRVEGAASEALGVDLADGMLAAPLEVGELRLSSRLVAGPMAAERDALAELASPALAGAGAVLTTDPVPADVIERVRSWCPVGWVAEGDTTVDEIEAAADAGFQLLQMPLEAASLAAWPVDRPFFGVVTAPGDAGGEIGDSIIESLLSAAAGRIVVATVVPHADANDPVAEPLLLCDRIKQETGLLVCLARTVANTDQAVTALLADRADLIQGLPSLVSPTWRTNDTVAMARTSA